MKFGMRKPSLKKSIKARTTGRAKRAVKKAVIPGYGKKGSGWMKDPKKAMYNKVYNKTTFGVNDVLSASSKSKSINKNSGDSKSSDFDVNTGKANNKIFLVNDSGKIKSCTLGYSWISLFIPIIYPLFRMDFKNFVIQFIFCYILGEISTNLLGLTWIIYCGFYNKIYLNDLIKKGYKPYNEESESLLKEQGFI